MSNSSRGKEVDPVTVPNTSIKPLLNVLITSSSIIRGKRITIKASIRPKALSPEAKALVEEEAN